MIETLIFIPFIIQMLAMAFDEGYFHIRRGLPFWERIGHPVDTFSVLLCLSFALYIPYSPAALKWFIGLSIFSCLMVTKDEWVHKHHCPGSENWLHALLFINHPIILTLIGLIWGHHSIIAHPEKMVRFLAFQTVGVALFMIYQIVYWNFIWKEKKVSQ